MARKKKETIDNDQAKNEKVNPTFSKEQILKSKNFQDSRDILNVVLPEGRSYTIDEAIQRIKEFKERIVR